MGTSLLALAKSIYYVSFDQNSLEQYLQCNLTPLIYLLR